MRSLALYYRLVLGVVLILCSGGIYAQTPEKVESHIKTWKLGEGLIRVDTTSVDTSYVNLPMRDVVNDYSIANSYNGNLISPIESKIFFDRYDNTDFLFGRAYAPYILTAENLQFYNTTTPYSKIAYKKGFTKYHEENDLDFAFTGNLNRRTNLGVTANYLNAAGLYANQAGKRFNGSVFGSYNGNHYSFQGGVTFNKLSNFENGGLANTEEVNYLNSILETEDYPVRLNAMSGLQHIAGFFNHYYSLTTERERQVSEDSVAIDYIPMTTFEHTFAVKQTTKRYIEQSANQQFYAKTYFDNRQTSDTAQILQIENTLAVTFEEEFNKWLRFGATVYATNTFERYTTAAHHVVGGTEPLNGLVHNDSPLLQQPLTMLNDTGILNKWTNNTYIGAAIYKKTGKWVKYHVQGDVCLAGYKLWEFDVNANITSTFPVGKDSMHVVVNGNIRNQQPDYFLQHYVSNHFMWDNNFDKTYHMYIGGNVHYPTKYVDAKVGVDFENILHHIYFGSDGLPHQHTGNIQVLAANANVTFKCPWLALENQVVYQHSSDEAIALPALSLYHNLYYYDWWFNALYVQIGADVRYNTSYYAPILNPALGQFCAQNTQKVGNHPIANLYANFYIKSLRLRLFAQWQHFNDLFTKDKRYYSMPDYPYNPSVFRAGIAWSFYN